MTLRDILEQSTLDWHDTNNPAEVIVCCPFCIENDESPDTRYRLGVNVETGQAHCFNCNWSSGDFLHTARELARTGDADMSVLRRGHKRAQPVPEKPVPVAPVYLEGLPRGYERFSFRSEFETEALDYLYGRGITKPQIERWEIGFAMVGRYSGRVVIPVHHDRRLVGVVGRDYTGNNELRYLNSESLRGVFGMKGNKHGVVSEGCMDALRMEPLFRDHDSLAIFGSNISEEQMRLLQRYESLTFFPDYDRPGCKGARTYCAECAEAGIRVRVSVPLCLDGSDPGTQSNEILLGRYRDAVLWSKAVKRRLFFREVFR